MGQDSSINLSDRTSSRMRSTLSLSVLNSPSPTEAIPSPKIMVIRSRVTSIVTCAALLSTTVAALSDAIPSLRLDFQVKRSTMAVNSATDFQVFVNPVVSEITSTGELNVSFNGKTTITNGDAIYTYLLVNGTTYQEVNGSTTTCYAAGDLPSISDVIDAFAAAVPVASVESTETIDCTNGTLLQTSFGGEDYVICSAIDADGAFKVFGADFNVEFHYLTEPVTISVPENAPANCQATVEDSIALNSASFGLLWGNPEQTFRRRSLRESAKSVSLASSSCGCNGTPRPCLFFHGMDVKADEGLVDSYSFFGDIKEHAPCCTDFKFAILNTVDYEWYNDTLQQKACDAALTVGTTSDNKTVEDLIIVAHSMGNNMLAGAVATGKCALADSVDWVALSGPMKGSMGSDFLHTVCDSGSVILSTLGGIIGQCPGTTTRKSLVYDGGEYCSAEESAQYAAARLVHQQHVTAGICGSTYSGLLSSEYLGLFFGGAIIPHHSSVNDGIVEFQSCIGNIDESNFAETYSSKFYKAKLNHADTTFHNGEGLFSSAKKPLKWFECLL